MNLGTKSSPVKGLFDETDDKTDEPNFDNAERAVFDSRTTDSDLELAAELAGEREAAEEEEEQGTSLPRSPAAPNTKRTFLTKAEELDLVLCWQKHRNHAARSKLLEVFWDKIVSFALSYYSGQSMDADDRMSLARIGFLKGIDKFNPDLDKRLWTCAKFWIRDALGEACRLSHSQAKRSKPRPIIAAAKKVILQEWNRGKRGADLYDATLARFRNDPDLARFKTPLSSAEYEEALALAFNMGGEFSLNSPIACDEDGDDELGPGFIDETIDDDPNNDDRRELISQALPLLDARSRHVIEARLLDRTHDQYRRRAWHLWRACAPNRSRGHRKAACR